MRLRGFDYKRPYYYMVTIKRNAGFAELSQVRREPLPACGDATGKTLTERNPARYLEGNAITRVCCDVIKTFHEKWYCIEPIEVFTIMPDHLHLIIKIRDIPERVSLSVIVRQLTRALERAYWAAQGLPPPLAGTCSGKCSAQGAGKCSALVPSAGRGSGFAFSESWHDWIVKRSNQLRTFVRYIRENPYRAWLRRQNAAYFQQVHPVSFLGRTWYAYGNPEILELPVLVPFKGHRATQEGSREWNEMLGRAERIGPGGAGVSTFMSPLEKAVGNAIYQAGGRMIVLCPEGFGERWHPPRNKEAYCAKGKMLFLSLYPADTTKPDKATMYQRCHEMVDLAMEGLSDEQ